MRIFLMLFFVCWTCTVADSAQAARFYIESQGKPVVGREVKLRVMVDSEKETLNAFEGKIIVPDNLLMKSVDDGGSIISLWLEKPPVSRHEMYFSGGLPGGYQGVNGVLFSMNVVADKQGPYFFELADFKALTNDGQGSEAKINNDKMRIDFQTASPQEIVELPNFKDLYPPEDFEVEIARNSDIYDGKYYLVFSTTDKDSGIDHYEVKEDGLEYKRALAPFPLSNQPPIGEIMVKAIDRAGNERIKTLETKKSIITEQDTDINDHTIYALFLSVLAILILFQIYKKLKN